MSGRNSFRTKIVGPRIIGLTGGIASGKNFVADIFAKHGAAVFDADKEVHKLLESDKSTIAAVEKKFPQSVVEGKIERKILREIVLFDDKKLKVLEKILHPKVRKKSQEFIELAKKLKKKFIVLNVPLLLETKGYKSDFIIAISASIALRKKRFLARSKNANVKIFDQIRAKQMSDVERKKCADFVVTNNKTEKDLAAKIEKIITKINAK